MNLLLIRIVPYTTPLHLSVSFKKNQYATTGQSLKRHRKLFGGNFMEPKFYMNNHWTGCCCVWSEIQDGDNSGTNVAGMFLRRSSSKYKFLVDQPSTTTSHYLLLEPMELFIKRQWLFCRLRQNSDLTRDLLFCRT
jgi:hypothetical protein